MKLEQQVCSLELAQKLKELGVKQESYFAWNKFGSGEKGDDFEWSIKPVSEYRLASDRNCSAFTVAELGEMLPKEVNIPFKNGKPRAQNNVLKSYFGIGRTPQVIYAKTQGNEYIHIKEDTEADARAQMLIYLLENKLITL